FCIDERIRRDSLTQPCRTRIRADGRRQGTSTTAREEGTMKTIKSNVSMKLLVACVLTAASPWWVQAESRGSGKDAGGQGPIRFAVIADPHLYQARLGTSGKGFEEYLAQDPKLLAESEAILKAALENIVQHQVQFLIIAGDLTKDGELADHVLMAQHL